MSTAVATTNGNGHAVSAIDPVALQSVLIEGDLSSLTPQQKNDYYLSVCRSTGLNPLTKPFAFIKFQGKEILYALRNCTDQLRQIYGISVVDMTEAARGDLCVVTCKVANAAGRTDMATGAVMLKGLAGEALANAIMKCETKSKRRATLSICGLSLLDETEVEAAPPLLNEDGEEIKPLPKKDAREAFSKMQNEIRLTQSVEGLRLWNKNNKDRRRILPEDWREQLNSIYFERLTELQQLGPNDNPRDDPPKDGDIDKFLAWADGVLGKVTTPDMLDPTYSFRIEPHIPDGLQADAVKVYEKHEARLAP